MEARAEVSRAFPETAWEELAEEVKAFQRDVGAELWHECCDERGGGKKDPYRHELSFLQGFLRGWMQEAGGPISEVNENQWRRGGSEA